MRDLRRPRLPPCPSSRPSLSAPSPFCARCSLSTSLLSPRVLEAVLPPCSRPARAWSVSCAPSPPCCGRCRAARRCANSSSATCAPSLRTSRTLARSSTPSTLLPLLPLVSLKLRPSQSPVQPPLSPRARLPALPVLPICLLPRPAAPWRLLLFLSLHHHSLFLPLRWCLAPSTPHVSRRLLFLSPLPRPSDSPRRATQRPRRPAQPPMSALVAPPGIFSCSPPLGSRHLIRARRASLLSSQLRLLSPKLRPLPLLLPN